MTLQEQVWFKIFSRCYDSELEQHGVEEQAACYAVDTASRALYCLSGYGRASEFSFESAMSDTKRKFEETDREAEDWLKAKIAQSRCAE
jgi:hypothetical protein